MCNVSYMELIFIDSEDQARKTNLALSLPTSAQTWAAFLGYRKFGVDIKQATFLLDYHKGNGDLSDTIAIDDEGFRAITGQEPMPEEAYIQIDTDFWSSAFSTPAEKE